MVSCVKRQSIGRQNAGQDGALHRHSRLIEGPSAPNMASMNRTSMSNVGLLIQQALRVDRDRGIVLPSTHQISIEALV